MGIVYLGYTIGTAIASGSDIPMTKVIRRKCSDVGLDMVLGNGYHQVDADIQLASTTGGDATVTVRLDGVDIAQATHTIGINGKTHIHLSSVLRVRRCEGVLTLHYAGPVLDSTEAEVTIADV